MATILNDISSLSEAEKFDLLDAIWEDLESQPPTLIAEQAGELDHRIAIDDRNPPAGTSWQQVKAGLPRR